jgi:Holliday junction resolvase RusA-like endonuclease
VKKLLFTARIIGLPKAQPRPRAARFKESMRIYNPKMANEWKAQIGRDCQALSGLKLEQGVAVELDFFMPRPNSHYKTNGNLTDRAPGNWHLQKPDADNLAKAVLDALSQIGAWEDDDQVCELTVRKLWEVADGIGPGLAIRLYIQ